MDSIDPGGFWYKGEKRSGKPGIVHPMQIPPVFMHPPMWLIAPRDVMLHWTTGPQQPISTRHSLSPNCLANVPSS